MLQGTGSDVGKTVLVAGLCRMARNRGIDVRPFKPQNKSNNAAVADIPGEKFGGEIGRAQWLQALAAGVKPSVHMNPALLKPQTDTGAQVIVQGNRPGERPGLLASRRLDRRDRGRRDVGRWKGVRRLSARNFRRGCIPHTLSRKSWRQRRGIDYRAEVERALDAIAGHLETHLDCDALFAAAR